MKEIEKEDSNKEAKRHIHESYEVDLHYVLPVSHFSDKIQSFLLFHFLSNVAYSFLITRVFGTRNLLSENRNSQANSGLQSIRKCRISSFTPVTIGM